MAKTVQILVNWIPKAELVNPMLNQLNQIVAAKNPQDGAYFMASSIAAAAVIMLETMEPDKVKALLSAIVDDADEQRSIAAKMRRMPTDVKQ